MNIFVLDKDATQAAYYMCDKHIVKMPTETMQMMCTNLDHLGYQGWLPMKPVMLNHPSTIWMRQSYGNWLWCIEHLESMLNNYTHTYDRIHMVEKHWDKMSDDVYAFLLEEYHADENEDADEMKVEVEDEEDEGYNEDLDLESILRELEEETVNEEEEDESDDD